MAPNKLVSSKATPRAVSSDGIRFIGALCDGPQVVLFIDEIHTVVGAGRTEGAMDAGNLLKPMLARGSLRCIGATTLDEYRMFIEKDPALERRFQQVLIWRESISLRGRFTA